MWATSTANVVGVQTLRYFRITAAPRQLRPSVGDGWSTWGRDSVRQQTVNGRDVSIPNKHLNCTAGDEKGVLHIIIGTCLVFSASGESAINVSHLSTSSFHRVADTLKLR